MRHERDAVAFEQIDAVYADGEGDPEQAVASIPQSLRSPSLPLGDFVKIRSTLRLDYVEIRDAEDTETSPAAGSPGVPASLGLGFDRGGWSLGLRGAYARARAGHHGPEASFATAAGVDRRLPF